MDILHNNQSMKDNNVHIYPKNVRLAVLNVSLSTAIITCSN